MRPKAPPPHTLTHAHPPPLLHNKKKSFHAKIKLSHLSLPASPPRAPLSIKNRPSHPKKNCPPLTGYSTYRIRLLKFIFFFHSCQILCPPETGYLVSLHRPPNITRSTLIAKPQLQGESPTYILNKDTQPVIPAIRVYHKLLAKMS